MPEPTPQGTISAWQSACWVSQMIHVAARLAIADHLAAGAQTAKSLAASTGSHPRSLYRLLRALASLGVFDEDAAGRFSLAPMGELLRSDVPGSQRSAALMMVGQFYESWGDLIESVRTGRSAFAMRHGRPFFESLADDPDEARIFDDAMTALNDQKTTAVLDAYDFSGVSVLADIGGGNGHNLFRTLRQYPRMRGILFDLPSVVSRVDPATEGLGDRCTVAGGSFLDAVPEGADVYLLRHILHNWDDVRSVDILRNVRRVLPPAGRLLVIDRVIPAGNGPSFAKLMDLTMLVVHGGAERTEDEFRRLFGGAGFRLTRNLPLGGDLSVLKGRVD